MENYIFSFCLETYIYLFIPKPSQMQLIKTKNVFTKCQTASSYGDSADKMTSEYKEEYCGSKNRSGRIKVALIKPCTKSLEEQPVGGRKILPASESSASHQNATTGTKKASCPNLPVPLVHKLRYCSNNYMTADDWY